MGSEVQLLQEADRAEGGEEDGAAAQGPRQRLPPPMLSVRGLRPGPGLAREGEGVLPVQEPPLLPQVQQEEAQQRGGGGRRRHGREQRGPRLMKMSLLSSKY